MKKILKIFFASAWLFIIMFSAKSQIKYLSNEIKSSLNAEDIAEIKNAERIKIQGDELMIKALLIEDSYGISMIKIEDYEAEKIRQMDSETIDVLRRAARKKIQASNYYGNWNLIITSIYTKRLKHLMLEVSQSDKKNINLLLQKNCSLMKTSELIRREALQMNNELLVYPYLMDAAAIEQMAINELNNAFLLIYKDAVIKEENSITLSKNKNTKSIDKLFFMIQVAASKTILSANQLRKISINNEIISVYNNAWYKYSISKKFGTYNEAFEYKQMLDASGAFILAFVDGEKVHISEAIKLQNTQTNIKPEKKKDKTVYRIRIGVSTLPFSDEKMRSMKSGGRPIVIVNYDGWYSYTVGNFSSKREALSFKKNKGLVNATVVAYKNGKSVENN